MKRFLLCLYAICIATTLFAQSGKCGPNLYWSVDRNTRTLKISGTGPMDSYNANETPWYPYREYIYRIIFEGTPTSLGTCALGGLKNCYSLTLPNSITSIEYKNFGIASFKEINLPASLSFIGKNTFVYNFGLIAINVDKNNPYFCSENGVLFNKGKTKLIHYPNSKSDVSYTIPNTVTTVEVFRNKYILSLTIPHSVISMLDGDISWDSNCPYLQTVYYEDGFNPLLVYGGKKPSRQLNFVKVNTPSRTTNGGNTQGAKERLETLKSMYDSGLITKEDYETKKNEILKSL